MMKLVALVWHRYGMDNPAEVRRLRLDVYYGKRIWLGEVGTEQQCVGEALGRSFHCELRRRVKGGIRPHRHRSASLFAWTCTSKAQRHVAGTFPRRFPLASAAGWGDQVTPTM